MDVPEPVPVPYPGSEFKTTHWSLVLLAARDDTPRAAHALNELCRIYWYPLFAFVRRSGQNPHDAEDAVQGFFAHLLESNWLTTADRSKGKLRSWLLSSLKYFLTNEWRARQAKKRGGGQEIISFDAHEAEQRYKLEPPDFTSPDALYDYNWAQSMMFEATKRLESAERASGLGDRFTLIKDCLYGQRADVPLAQLAERSGTTEAALKSAIVRLRQRWRSLLREVVAETVAAPDQTEGELRNLTAILRDGLG